MRKVLCLLLAFMTVFSVVACESGPDGENSDKASATESTEIKEESESKMEITKTITTLDYKNYGRMGDLDGPAFAVYSKPGYSGVSVEVDIENSEINCAMTDGKFVNGYAFVGVDIYGVKGWENCVDAGLCWAGADEGWHVFYNIFETLNPNTESWYESRKKLPYNDVYVMTFEIVEDNYALLTVTGKKTGATDSIKVEVKGAKKSGINTAFLFNAAMDFPPDTIIDRKGNYCENDWPEVVLANTDKNAYLKNLLVTDMKLIKGGKALKWENDMNSSVAIWPDMTYKKMDYSPTKVDLYDGSQYYIHFDMNR